MKSLITKHSIILAGHKTSISLEDEFWESLRDIAKERHKGVSQLVARIDAERQHANLSSAIRLFVVAYYKQQCAPARSMNGIKTDDRVSVQ
jgi:predicted DNA-binding ribbon-helix-helix protein